MKQLILVAGVALASQLWPHSAWAINKCVGKSGQTLYQSGPCPTDTRGSSLNVDISSEPGVPIVQPEKAPVRVAEPAPLPPQVTSPRKSLLDQMADRCLDWYRPNLKDPRAAYHQEASYDSGTHLLSMTIYGTNTYGGVTSKAAACEINGGVLDDGWTKIHAKRLGWAL